MPRITVSFSLTLFQLTPAANAGQVVNDSKRIIGLRKYLIINYWLYRVSISWRELGLLLVSSVFFFVSVLLAGAEIAAGAVVVAWPAAIPVVLVSLLLPHDAPITLSTEITHITFLINPDRISPKLQKTRLNNTVINQ